MGWQWHQHLITQFLRGQLLFLMPSQQCQSTEDKKVVYERLSYYVCWHFLMFGFWSFDLFWSIFVTYSWFIHIVGRNFFLKKAELHVFLCSEWRWMAEGDEAGFQRACSACTRWAHRVCLWTVYEWTGSGALLHTRRKSHSVLPTYVSGVGDFNSTLVSF